MIEVKDLVKRYGNHAAVDHLSFTVDTGKVVGFLGPNGAGKSTTMNMITGYIAPTEGTVLIDGIDMSQEPEKAKENIGYLPEIPPLYQDLRVREYLQFVAELKKLPKKERNLAVYNTMKETKTNNAPAAIGPYSQAIEVNGMVYTSGIIPVVPETGEIPEGSVAQAKQALTNLSNLLEAAGTSMANVVKTTVFIKEMNDFGAINEVYATFFDGAFPSRSCVEVARLPKDVMLEIEAIAVK